MIGQDTVWRPRYPEPPVPAASPVTVIREWLEAARRGLEFIPTLSPSYDETKGVIKGLEFALRALGVES